MSSVISHYSPWQGLSIDSDITNTACSTSLTDFSDIMELDYDKRQSLGTYWWNESQFVLPEDGSLNWDTLLERYDVEGYNTGSAELPTEQSVGYWNSNLFYPDATATTSFAVERGNTTANLFKYYDPTIESQRKDYDLLVAPAEVQITFDPQTPGEIDNCTDYPWAGLTPLNTEFSPEHIQEIYVAFVEWGDGSRPEFESPLLIYEDSAGGLTDNNVMYHTYENSGIYKITGLMFAVNDVLKVSYYKQFEMYINLNKDLSSEEEFQQLGGSGYTFIPYNETVPVIGGTSHHSMYNKSVKGRIGENLNVEAQSGLHGDSVRLHHANIIMNGEDLTVDNFLYPYTLPISTDCEDEIPNCTDWVGQHHNLIHSGSYRNPGELGDHLGNVDLAQIRAFTKPYQIHEMLGYLVSTAEEEPVLTEQIVKIHIAMTPQRDGYAGKIVKFYVGEELINELVVDGREGEYLVELEFPLGVDDAEKEIRISIEYDGHPWWHPENMRIENMYNVVILDDLQYDDSSSGDCSYYPGSSTDPYYDDYDYSHWVCLLTGEVPMPWTGETIPIWILNEDGSYNSGATYLNNYDSLGFVLSRAILETSLIDATQETQMHSAGNPASENYWRNIIPEDTAMTDRDGLYVNAIPDGSFETRTYHTPYLGPAVHNGTLEFSTEESLFGGVSLKYESTGYGSYTNSNVFHPIKSNALAAAAPGETWIFSGYCKSLNQNARMSMFIFGLKDDYEWIGSLGDSYVGDEMSEMCTDEWQRFSNTITFTHQDVRYVSTRLDNNFPGKIIYWDGLQLEKSPTPSEFSSGIISVEEGASQEWLGQNEYGHTYYYPVLPKYNGFGRLDETLGLQGQPEKIPFGHPDRAWNEDETKAYVTADQVVDPELRLDLDFSSISDNTMYDLSSGNNLGMLMRDYAISLSERGMFQVKRAGANRLRLGTKNKKKAF